MRPGDRALWLAAITGLAGGCGASSKAPERFAVEECVGRTRLVVVPGRLCEGQQPDSSSAGAAAEMVVIAEWTRGGERPPILEVPDGTITVIAECLDEDGVVTSWGCDDDGDGELNVEVDEICRDYDCDGCEDDCGSDAFAWSGAGGPICVAACACRDSDRDGHRLSECGGDDCDDQTPAIPAGTDDEDYGAWGTADVADPGPGGELFLSAAIAMDSSDQPHVVAQIVDGGDHMLEYFTRSGSGWSDGQVFARNEGGFGVSIAMDGEDHPFVAHRHADGRVRLAVGTDGDFTGCLVDDAGAFAKVEDARTGLAIDPEGLAHVVFHRSVTTEHSAGLAYAVGTCATGFETQTVGVPWDGDAGHWPALALDPAADRHVVFVDLGGEAPALIYGHWSGTDGQWDFAEVDVPIDGYPFDPAITLEDGVVHVAYWVGERGSMLVASYAVGNAGGFQVTRLYDLTAGTGSGPSIAVAGGAAPLLVFDSPVGRDAAYAQRPDGGCTWAIEGVAGSGLLSPRLALGSDGTAVLVSIVVDSVNDAEGDILRVSQSPWGNGVDDDCDGVLGTDADGDGFASARTGGSDCDDADPFINPDAEDSLDGIDRNCDCIL